MAASSDRNSGVTPSEASTFKGHPQPPPDERLQECKNFLADEDVNHNLYFKDRLIQIEEYVKNLEDKKVECSQNLLRDVKTMATVQREWMEHYMETPPWDNSHPAESS